MQPLNLFFDEPNYELQLIQEEKNANEPRTFFIQGYYLMSEQKNKNGRIYNINEMVQEVGRYTSEMIKNGRSIGELNHPESVDINPERACHMVVEFKQENNMFLGKSKILNTPLGQLTRTLMLDGVKLGISSRALGKLMPGANDAHMVQGFHLICCDVVHDPSVSNAFVNGILESKKWILQNDGSVAPAYEALERNLSVLPKHGEDKAALFEQQILEFIKNLSKNSK